MKAICTPLLTFNLDSATAEKCFLDHIAPLPKSIADEAAWVDRLITISRHLGIPDFKRLKQLTRIATKYG